MPVGKSRRGAVLEPWVSSAGPQFRMSGARQFLVVNDCLHRFRHAANWTFCFDVDGTYICRMGERWKTVLNELSTIPNSPLSRINVKLSLCQGSARITGNGDLRSWYSGIQSLE
ncbi:hypothetical protein HPP92_003840 [Vanilla planifolia]|uniref:Glycosyltransferase family 92 protein n=1 Tax=Vanilla planifolia TaxID=51239 RepID=A0A835VFW0_VANPL|nr:hypothetical protein HPP92_003840 [Vanilla planifolia]